MKFFCDRCNAKYSIADEKVRGKVVKVRCKRCGDIIEVSEEKNQAGTSPPKTNAGQQRDAGGDTTEWYYSVEGQTFGPLSKDRLVDKYESGELSANSYVWKDSFSEWRPATDVEPFSTLLDEQTKSISGISRRKRGTMGVGDSIEAVESPDEDSHERRPSRPDSSGGGSGRRSSGGRDSRPGSGGRGRGSSGNRDSSSGSERGNSGGRGRSERRSSGRGRGSTSSDGGRDRSRSGRRRGRRDSDDDGGRDRSSSESRRERLERLRGKLKSNFDPDDSGDESSSGSSVGGGLGASSSAVGSDSGPAARGGGSGAAAVDLESSGGGVPSPEEIDEPESEEPSRRESPDGDGLPAPDFDEDGDETVEVSPDKLSGLEEVTEDADIEGLDAYEEADEGAPLEVDEDEDDEGFSLPPAGSSRLDDEPDPDSAPPMPEDEEDTHPDLFDEEEADDEKPSLPTAPKLGDQDEQDEERSEPQGMTQSLLIQLDKIQEESSSARYIGAAAAAALLLLGAGITYFLFLAPGSKDEPKKQKQEIVGVPQNKDPVQKTYSQDEILALKPQKVQEKKEGGTGDESGGGSGGGGSGGGESGGEGGLIESGGLLETDDSSMDQAMEGATKKSDDDEGGSRSGSGRQLGSSQDFDQSGAVAEAESDESGSGSDSRQFAAMQAIEGDSPSVEDPTEAAADRGSSGGGRMPLSKQQIREGIKGVRKSVASCRRRHARRGTPMEVGKIYVTLTIENTGKVSDYALSPNKVNGTVFERCLASHEGRWNFGPFNGSSQKLKAPFILQ